MIAFRTPVVSAIKNGDKSFNLGLSTPGIPRTPIQAALILPSDLQARYVLRRTRKNASRPATTTSRKRNSELARRDSNAERLRRLGLLLHGSTPRYIVAMNARGSETISGGN
jgi:hypothetical protein